VLLQSPACSGVLGCFEQRVTLYSQQVRALNLIYALLEERVVPPEGCIAVIGAGAAGMTAAAAAAFKGCRVVLLEQQSDLLSLQSGNMTRWLHPHIYDWPSAFRVSPISLTINTKHFRCPSPWMPS
jgi:hypothetical protein